MIYLYGVSGPLAELPQSSGLGGAPLRSETVGELTALYSSHDQLELRADAGSCWTHERAVEAVMRVQAVLPARFGTTFAGLDELRAAVSRDAPGLRERLAAVQGCVELAVRINPVTPRDGEAATGRQYLMDKLTAQRRREALAESTLACLREFAVASRLAASHSADEAVSISYLVKAGGVERFSHMVGRLQKRWPEFALSCTGPWAPYSFATVAAPPTRDVAA
jgi:hypothetical protein